MPPRRRPRHALALLVRHGKTATTGTILPGRAPGLSLSETGGEQAAAAAERIAALEPAPVAVYASPLERTLETAAPIARRLGLRVRRERRVVECDFGEWTGRELKTLMRLPEWQTVQRLPGSFRFPGGESFAEMQTRMVAALDELAERHAGERFVVVSHADPIKAALAAVAGIPLDLFQRLVVGPCSVSAVVRGGGASQLLCANSTGSLAELART